MLSLGVIYLAVIASTQITNEAPPYIYENKEVLPRSYFVKTAKKFKEDKEIFNYMKKGFDPKREVILKEEPEGGAEEEGEIYFPPPKGGEGFEPHAKIIEYKLNSVKIIVDAPTSGYLFLSDTYYPGWEAYVDNKKTKIYRANYCFRAVAVPQGKHTVLFVYRPKTFYIGCIGSLLSFLLIASYLIYSWQREKRRKKIEDLNPDYSTD